MLAHLEGDIPSLIISILLHFFFGRTASGPLIQSPAHNELGVEGFGHRGRGKVKEVPMEECAAVL